MTERHKPIGRMIKQLSEIIDSSTNELSDKQDVTSSQVAVLAFLHMQEGRRASRSDIKEFMGCSQPTVTGIVQRMEKKGLVEIVPEHNMPRKNLVHLTGYGAKKWEAGFMHMEMVEDRILSPLSENERTIFCECLEKILEGLSGGYSAGKWV